ncbi:MAG: F0F1 ATP synthase subunit C [Kordiimonadaceae bacterium]|nr:F0F1 ATP synthase subunit C [Kordiimonadaceae bacterium]
MDANTTVQIAEIAASAEIQSARYIGAGIAALALGGIGIGLGAIFGNYLSGALRNPSAAPKQFTNLLIGFALTEATGLFALVIAFLALYG